MKVILIQGKAQNGKDSAANMLRSSLEQKGKRVLITHYADLLKYICKSFFNWDGEKDEYGRYLLQHIGTDVVRVKYPDMWVDFIITILNVFTENWDYVIIPDTRFPNEVNKMKDSFDTTLIRVIRENFVSPLTKEQQEHLSETALDNFPVDIILKNDSGLNALRQKVDDIVNGWENNEN